MFPGEVAGEILVKSQCIQLSSFLSTCFPTCCSMVSNVYCLHSRKYHKIPAKLLGKLPNPMFFMFFGAKKPSSKSFPQHFPGSNSSAPRKRQAAITAEICEISAAANAIEAADKKGAAGPGLGVMDNENSVAEDFMKELDSGDVPDTWNGCSYFFGGSLAIWTHTHTHIYIIIYIYICVCVLMYIYMCVRV